MEMDKENTNERDALRARSGALMRAIWAIGALSARDSDSERLIIGEEELAQICSNVRVDVKTLAFAFKTLRDAGIFSDYKITPEYTVFYFS